MAKVTGQTIDPSLEALYLAITSPGKIEQGPDGEIRVKKGKKAPKRRPAHNLDLAAFRFIAETIARALYFAPGTPAFNDQVFTILQELAVGYVNPAYFKKCPVVSAVTLESTPTSIEDPAPPPYGYRTAANLPTLPTYPDGAPTANPPGYAGAKVDNLFKDTYLRWRKIVFSASAIKRTDGEKRVLLKWNTTITINAGSRGSRPMLSLHVKGRICGETGSDMDSTTPPLLKKTSLYWRFKIPPSAPPYYNSYQVRNIVKPFARFAKKSGSGLFSYYLLNASNRPMAGRGFNNNDNVLTTFDEDPELWEIAPCLGAPPVPIVRNNAGQLGLYDYITGETFVSELPANTVLAATIGDTALVLFPNKTNWLTDSALNPVQMVTLPPQFVNGINKAYRYQGSFIFSTSESCDLWPFNKIALWKINPDGTCSKYGAPPPFNWPVSPDQMPSYARDANCYPWLFAGIPGHSKTGWYHFPGANTGPSFLKPSTAETADVQDRAKNRFYVGLCDRGPFTADADYNLYVMPWPDEPPGTLAPVNCHVKTTDLHSSCSTPRGLVVRRNDGKWGLYDLIGFWTEYPAPVGIWALEKWALCGGSDN